MAWYFIILIFLVSCVVLSWLSSRLIESLVKIAKYLQWREFTIAFFVMSVAASLPDLFISVNAAIQGKPLLALGDILGGNLVDLTLVSAVAIFFSKKGLSTQSGTVQASAIFTAAIAVLPLLLILDGNLNRVDGIILIATFFLYAWWLFSKSDHFKKRYRGKNENPIVGFKGFLVNLVKVIVLVGLLLGASQAVIMSAQFFSNALGISLALVGLLIVGLGNAFPDMYFGIISARKDENWMVLGDIMGSVIICATLVLGIVGVFFPFHIADFAPFATARIFLIVAAILSLVFIRTGGRISKKEGLILLALYISFLLVEIFIA